MPGLCLQQRQRVRLGQHRTAASPLLHCYTKLCLSLTVRSIRRNPLAHVGACGQLAALMREPPGHPSRGWAGRAGRTGRTGQRLAVQPALRSFEFPRGKRPGFSKGGSRPVSPAPARRLPPQLLGLLCAFGKATLRALKGSPVLATTCSFPRRPGAGTSLAFVFASRASRHRCSLWFALKESVTC